jgi:sensor histidine kinase regulating citrate/malate metabolism
MNIKKIVIALLTINVLQFLIGLIIWITARYTFRDYNLYIYLVVGLLLFSNLITICGLYFAIRYKNDSMEDSIKNLEELNTKLRSQRHDYLNHFQVIYGLMELEEYDEAKKYIDPVFKDIMKVSKALKTSLPAVNALLQAKIEVAEKHGIDLFLEIRSDLKHIPIEPWNLCKVLANIIDNSITVLVDKQGDRKIRFDISEDQNSYIFFISNNGSKIPEHLLGEIFKQGFTTKNESGHGMGLYIVSKIVHETGGIIQVTSKDEITSFHIEIPKAAK